MDVGKIQYSDISSLIIQMDKMLAAAREPLKASEDDICEILRSLSSDQAHLRTLKPDGVIHKINCVIGKLRETKEILSLASTKQDGEDF